MDCTRLFCTEEAPELSLAGHRLVVEFWHTKCTRCPAALQRMEEQAAEGAKAKVMEKEVSSKEAGATPSTLYLACALSTSPTDDAGERRRVEDLLEDGEAFPHLMHAFMTFAQKEEAKKRFGFTAVPHCVILDADGAVGFSGSPDAAVQRL